MANIVKALTLSCKNHYKEFYKDIVKAYESFSTSVIAENLKEGEEGDNEFWDAFDKIFTHQAYKVLEETLKNVYNIDTDLI